MDIFVYFKHSSSYVGAPAEKNVGIYIESRETLLERPHEEIIHIYNYEHLLRAQLRTQLRTHLMILALQALHLRNLATLRWRARCGALQPARYRN